MKCPYPDCPHESLTAPRAAGEIYCCPKCRRLSWTCNQKKCHAQNRLFTRFCRRCRGTLYSVNRDSHGLKQWEAAAGFLTDWYFRHPDAPEPAGTAVPQPKTAVEILELGALEGFDPAARVLLEMTFVDGLLAVHQGGGSLAVIHPFSDGRDAIAWHMAESELIPQPVMQESHAATFRPFPPVTSLNRRHVLFSTSYAVLALDLWKLPGWATGGKMMNCRPIFHSTGEAAPRLAAPPVPFGGPTDAFGLLLRTTDNRYLWKIVELTPAAGGKVRAELHGVANAEYLKDAVELPLKGEPCQAGSVEDEVVTFATPYGHWIWPHAAAFQRDLTQLFRTREPAGKFAAFYLDKHVEDRSAFRYPRQVVHLDPDRDINTRLAQTLNWYYRLSEDNSLEMYSVNLPLRESRRPRKSTGYPKAEPIGLRIKDRLPEMLFRGGDRFFRRGHGQDELDSIGDLNLQSGQVIGFDYQNPLLLTVSGDPRSPRKMQVDLLSVSSMLTAQTAMAKKGSAAEQDQSEGGQRAIQARLDPRRMTFEQLDLIAMPLVWSRWLFTLERRENEQTREQQVVLLRRELPVCSTTSPPGADSQPTSSHAAHPGAG